MSAINRLGQSVGAALLVGGLVVSLPSAVAAKPSQQHALLIGINDYQNLPPLNGAVNDVAVVRQLLVERFKFVPASIVEITDKAATRQGILQALQTLAGKVQPDDLVYFHYSGHGSQVKDLDGDEEDGLDETIAPQDARSEGIPDITDDELDRAFAALKSKALIVTLDSCHSGTGLRSARLRIRQRSVPQDDRLHLYQRLGQIRTRAIVPLAATEPYVLFTGAADYQSALDGPFADGRYHGLFTYAYTQALQELTLGSTPVQIMEQVKLQIQALRSELGGYLPPEPQLEGPAARLEKPLL